MGGNQKKIDVPWFILDLIYVVRSLLFSSFLYHKLSEVTKRLSIINCWVYTMAAFFQYLRALKIRNSGEVAMIATKFKCNLKICSLIYALFNEDRVHLIKKSITFRPKTNQSFAGFFLVILTYTCVMLALQWRDRIYFQLLLVYVMYIYSVQIMIASTTFFNQYDDILKEDSIYN